MSAPRRTRCPAPLGGPGPLPARGTSGRARGGTRRPGPPAAPRRVDAAGPGRHVGPPSQGPPPEGTATSPPACLHPHGRRAAAPELQGRPERVADPRPRGRPALAHPAGPRRPHAAAHSPSRRRAGAVRICGDRAAPPSRPGPPSPSPRRPRCRRSASPRPSRTRRSRSEGITPGPRVMPPTPAPPPMGRMPAPRPFEGI